jgi:hypothetical protein
LLCLGDGESLVRTSLVPGWVPLKTHMQVSCGDAARGFKCEAESPNECVENVMKMNPCYDAICRF